MERTNTKCSGLSTIRVQTIRQTFNNINMIHLADNTHIYIYISRYDKHFIPIQIQLVSNEQDELFNYLKYAYVGDTRFTFIAKLMNAKTSWVFLGVTEISDECLIQT